MAAPLNHLASVGLSGLSVAEGCLRRQAVEGCCSSYKCDVVIGTRAIIVEHIIQSTQSVSQREGETLSKL